MANPLLEQHTLPPFSKIKVQHIEPAVDAYLQAGRELIAKQLKQDHFTWDNLIAPLQAQADHFSQAWSPVSHLHAVKNTPELRVVYQDCVAKISEYYAEMGQNHDLFMAYQAIKDSAGFVHLSQAQQKTIDDALRDFKLSGVALAQNEKTRFKQIQQKLSALTTQFETNVMDATDHWFYQTENKAELAGLPEHTLHAAKDKAKHKKLTGWCLGLDFPTYIAVMRYADNRQLRETFYTAFSTRASDQGPDANQFDNSQMMQEILALRHEEAQLLGFNNFAELSIASKMAQSTDEVLQFLTDLANRAKPVAKKELQVLQQFAASKGFKATLQVWDMTYYAEKLQQEKYGLSQETLRPYFQVDKVMKGLFTVIGKLYGMTVKPRQVDTWDRQVTFYDITDAQDQLRGSFYMDLYARPHKRGGAWMDECRVRWMTETGQLQYPVAYLNCNFAPPVGDKPACITHDDMVTLFHEFGHCMHHMMTQIDVAAVSGINGVEWDAVELPSQFMENFCWQSEVMDLVSSHVETGEKLPVSLFTQLQQSRIFQSGMALARQMEFSIFDFILHRDYSPANPKPIQQVLDEVRQQVAVIIPPQFNRFQNSFSHIFAGGYAAGYYSYKWAEVLSADAFSKFEDEGVFNPGTGAAFLQSILEKGGSQKAMALFVAFRGREPKINALLKQCGITS